MRLWMTTRRFLAAESAQTAVTALIGGLLLLVAYMLYPEPFHNFGRFLIDTLIESARDAFGNSDDGGAKDPGQIRIKGHTDPR